MEQINERLLVFLKRPDAKDKHFSFKNEKHKLVLLRWQKGRSMTEMLANLGVL